MGDVTTAISTVFSWITTCMTTVTGSPLLLALVVAPLALGVLGGLLAIFRR